MKATGTFLAVCIAFCSLASPSLAQGSQKESSPSIELKSEKTAQTLILLGTLIPWGLFLQGLREDHTRETELWEILAIAGFFAVPIGPSLGYFYAGSTWRGLAVTSCFSAIKNGGIADSIQLLENLSLSPGGRDTCHNKSSK